MLFLDMLFYMFLQSTTEIFTIYNNNNNNQQKANVINRREQFVILSDLRSLILKAMMMLYNYVNVYVHISLIYYYIIKLYNHLESLHSCLLFIYAVV